MEAKGHRPSQHFNWGPSPCIFELRHLLIKVGNDEFAHMTHKKRVNLYTCLLSKLQRIACMLAIRDRTDQLDNQDIAKEFIERNKQCRNYFKQF